MKFIGYLHAGNAGTWKEQDGTLSLRVGYDPHYCRYFDQKESSWSLELADWLESSAGKISAIRVDGKKIQLSSTQSVIPVPAGSGEHKIEVEF